MTMTDNAPDLDIDLADLAPQDWMARLDALGEEHGYFEQLGKHHLALFIDAGKKLLVTFETVEGARKSPGAMPRGFDFVTRNGWSLLAIFAKKETWFRSQAVYGTFDRLTDDGFFEDFDQVLFLGEGPSGYAAAAYSVASPGARVVAIRPHATLDPTVAGWDRRHFSERWRDFTSRYGYGPEMVEAANRAYILYDPSHAPDAMHAALYHRDNVTMLRCPLSGTRTESVLDQMQITAPMVDAAMEGSLNPLIFARLWRARRQNVHYLRMILKRAEGIGRPSLIEAICRHGLTTKDRALFARKLAEIGVRDTAPIAAAE